MYWLQEGRQSQNINPFKHNQSFPAPVEQFWLWRINSICEEGWNELNQKLFVTIIKKQTIRNSVNLLENEVSFSQRESCMQNMP